MHHRKNDNRPIGLYTYVYIELNKERKEQNNMETEEDEGEIDYEGMYEQLSKRKNDYQEQLRAVILSCASLELSIYLLCKTRIKKISSQSLKEWNEKPFTPITTKLNMLRFADIIDEKLYRIIYTLFKVRNVFAHRLPFPEHFDNVFDSLNSIDINNDFVKSLHNDFVKFQLITSYCNGELMDISEKLDPTSVIHLTTGEGATIEKIDY